MAPSSLLRTTTDAEATIHQLRPARRRSRTVHYTCKPGAPGHRSGPTFSSLRHIGLRSCHGATGPLAPAAQVDAIATASGASSHPFCFNAAQRGMRCFTRPTPGPRGSVACFPTPQSHCGPAPTCDRRELKKKTWEQGSFCWLLGGNVGKTHDAAHRLSRCVVVGFWTGLSHQYSCGRLVVYSVLSKVVPGSPSLFLGALGRRDSRPGTQPVGRGR